MGDVCITITFRNNNQQEEQQELRLAGDSTLRAVVDCISNHFTNNTTVYDCTYHPPKELTSVIQQYNEYTGPQSITLQSLGWFPSALLTVTTVTDNTTTTVQQESTTTATNPNRPLPSQLMANAVAVPIQPQVIATNTTTKQKPRKQTERERMTSLNVRLKRLEESSSTNSVSNQVKQILIKRRSKGNATLRDDDRFHLEIVVFHNNDHQPPQQQSPQYKFYSKYDNAGTVAMDNAKPFLNSNTTCEFLIRNNTTESYQRIHNTMALYEAHTNGYLQPFDRIFIRIFSTNTTVTHTEPITTKPTIPTNNKKEKSTTTVATKPVTATTKAAVVTTTAVQQELCTKPVATIEEEAVVTTTTAQQQELWNHIHAAVQAMKLPNGKKASKLSESMRRIFVKSHANTKNKLRIPQAQMLYMHVIVIQDTVAKSCPMLVSQYDSIQVIVPSTTSSSSTTQILIPKRTNDKEYTIVNDTTIRFIDLKEQLSSLDRIIVRTVT